MDITAINHFVYITLVMVGTSLLFAAITAINHFVDIKPVLLTAINHIWLNIPNLWNLIPILDVGQVTENNQLPSINLFT